MIARIAFSSLLATVALCATPASATTEIVRCIATGGGVTYQQSPCPEGSVAQFVGIPTQFPAPDIAQRDRLFEREAALYRRLEARRDREIQEAILRDAHQERELERARLAAAAAQPPQYLVVLPPRTWRSHRVRHPLQRTSAFW